MSPTLLSQQLIFVVCRSIKHTPFHRHQVSATLLTYGKILEEFVTMPLQEQGNYEPTKRSLCSKASSKMDSILKWQVKHNLRLIMLKEVISQNIEGDADLDLTRLQEIGFTNMPKSMIQIHYSSKRIYPLMTLPIFSSFLSDLFWTVYICCRWAYQMEDGSSGNMAYMLNSIKCICFDMKCLTRA